jgi:membrane fusion protein (multidrug efflux system)
MLRIRHLILTSALLLVLAACGSDDAAGPGAPDAAAGGPPQMPPTAVEAVVVKREAIGSGLSTVGTLRADEQVVIRPEITARLVEIHFEEGQRVAAGAPLFSLDAASAQAALAEAQANLENARRANERADDLGGRQLLSKSEVDTARAQLGVAQARVASARAQSAKTTLVAPFNGVVGLREVSVGEVVAPGQALVNFVRMDPMEVDFSLPETALAQVAVGQEVTLSIDAFPEEAFGGRISAIEPMIDPATRSAKLRAQVDNAGYRLRPGLFARIPLGAAGADAATAIMVPEAALMQEGDDRFVYVVRDGKAARATVKTGPRQIGRIAVLEGLNEGDQVVSAGQAKLFEGAPVSVVPTEAEQKAAADAPGGAGAGPGDGSGESPAAVAADAPAGE